MQPNSPDVLAENRAALGNLLPRQQRRSCSIWAKMVVDSHDAHGLVQNISTGGVSARMDSIVRLRNGQLITVVCDELGSVDCTVRWSAHPDYGLEFDERGKRSTKVQSYFNSLPAVSS
jgi:PilZ domain